MSKFYPTVQFLETTDAHYVRTKFQWFLSDAPCSSFKKLIVSTPRLLRNLHTMSLAKAAPNGLKDRECKKMLLCKCPPIPYEPEKNSVWETDSSFKDNHLKTPVNKGTELRIPIWHSGTRKAFLIHVGSAQEVIEKKGYLKSYEEYSGTDSKIGGGGVAPLLGASPQVWLMISLFPRLPLPILVPGVGMMLTVICPLFRKQASILFWIALSITWN